jgi:hypothetical protein
VFYVELREYLVRRAIERARHLSRDEGAYEKRKHDDALPRLELGEDGELVDFPMREDTNYERRS